MVYNKLQKNIAYKIHQLRTKQLRLRHNYIENDIKIIALEKLIVSCRDDSIDKLVVNKRKKNWRKNNDYTK